MEKELKHSLSERLCKIADQMEIFADDEDNSIMKQLRREYKSISKLLYPPKKENQYSAKELKESRAEALKTVEKYLSSDNIEEQFNGRGGEYHSKDKFLVSWKGNYNGFRVECSLDKTSDNLFSRAKCIQAKRSLVMEKQVKAYGSFERGLIEVGLLLCPNREAKKEFFNRYVVKYNERIKSNETT